MRSGGSEGMAPTPELQRIMDIIDEAKLSGRDRQVELAQELFKIWADNVWEIGTVGLTPMVQGRRSGQCRPAQCLQRLLATIGHCEHQVTLVLSSSITPSKKARNKVWHCFCRWCQT